MIDGCITIHPLTTMPHTAPQTRRQWCGGEGVLLVVFTQCCKLNPNALKKMLVLHTKNHSLVVVPPSEDNDLVYLALHSGLPAHEDDSDPVSWRATKKLGRSCLPLPCHLDTTASSSTDQPVGGRSLKKRRVEAIPRTYFPGTPLLNA